MHIAEKEKIGKEKLQEDKFGQKGLTVRESIQYGNIIS
jgi:hypothetical protein